MKFPPSFKKVSSSYLTFFLLALSLLSPSSGLVPCSKPRTQFEPSFSRRTFFLSFIAGPLTRSDYLIRSNSFIIVFTIKSSNCLMVTEYIIVSGQKC